MTRLNKIILIIFGICLFFVYEFTAQKNERQIKFNTALLNALDEVIWVKDTNDILLFISERYCKDVLNDTIKPRQLIGKSAVKVFGKENNDRFKSNDSIVIKSGLSSKFIEYSFNGNDTIFFKLRKAPLKDRNGIIYATVGILE